MNHLSGDTSKAVLSLAKTRKAKMTTTMRTMMTMTKMMTRGSTELLKFRCLLPPEIG
jgi:hypothetical protein